MKRYGPVNPAGSERHPEPGARARGPCTGRGRTPYKEPGESEGGPTNTPTIGV